MTGIQSILDARGPQAQNIAHLWWVFFWVCVAGYVIVVAVVFIALVHSRRNAVPDETPKAKRNLTINVGIATAITATILIGLLTASVATGRAVGTFGQDKPD